MDPFQQRKTQTLADLQDADADKSRKGSVDAQIADLVESINGHADVFTTSSCSGRITVFAEPTAITRASGKKGGEWVFASHDIADADTVISKVKDRTCSGARLIFRFEPFILAAECRSVDVGRHLLAVARQAGFRESGLHIAERVILSVRCSLRLEAPIADEGQLLVTDQYIQYLVKLANEKMLTNWQRVGRLEAILLEVLSKPFPTPSKLRGSKTKGRNMRRGESTQCEGQEQEKSEGEANIHKSKKSKQKGRPARKPAVPMKNTPDSCTGQLGAESSLKVRQEALLSRLKEAEEKLAQVDAGLPTTPAWTPLVAATGDKACNGVHNTIPKCWGHSALLVGSAIVVFGGYGGSGQHTRSNDVAVFDTQLGVWREVHIKGDVRPQARTGHSAVAIGRQLLVIGGRTHPKQPLDDAFLLDLDSATWTQLSSGPKPGNPRWPGSFRHSAVAVGDELSTVKVFVFGGKGPDGELSNDVWLLQQSPASQTQGLLAQDYTTCSTGAAVWTWEKLACTGDVPTPRKSHAACLAADNQCMLVYGGIGPAYGTYHNSLYSLDLQSLHWSLVMGSRSSVQDSRPQWSLNNTPGKPACLMQNEATSHVTSMSDRPSPLLQSAEAHHPVSSMPMAVTQKGGDDKPHGTALLDKDTVAPLAACAVPPACYSHTLTAVPGTDLLLRYGGCPAAAQQSMHVLDWRKRLCWKVEVPFPRELVAMRHAAVIAERTIYSIGGGAFCFSFGSVFSSHFRLDLTFLSNRYCPPTNLCSWNPAIPAAHTPNIQTSQDTQSISRQGQHNTSEAGGVVLTAASQLPHGDVCPSTESSTHDVRPDTDPSLLPPIIKRSHESTQSPSSSNKTASSSALPNAAAHNTVEGSNNCTSAGARGQGSRIDEGGCFALVVPKKAAKAVKDVLKAQGWLERSIRTGSIATEPDTVPLPLKPAAAAQLQAHDVSLPRELLEALQTGAQVSCLAWADITTNQKHQAAQGPLVQLKLAVGRLLTEQLHLSEEDVERLCNELPTKWEKLGDLVLIPATSMRCAQWQRCGAEVWRIIAKALQAKRVARQAAVANTGTRDSRATLLLGGTGWVSHRESGVTFTLDVTRCMFSSGNVTERTRMGKLNCQGETVLDLYTGIGYYTLPILVKGGASRVVACEWNPHAVEALRRNLEVNGVSDRCEVRVGDCRMVAPQEPICDRVLLGLLPSSQGGWDTAVRALKDQGGWLHIHENVLDSEQQHFAADTINKLLQIAKQHGRNFSFSIHHVERVKWYAPHIRHIVMDVEVTPLRSASVARGEQMLASATQRPAAFPMTVAQMSDRGSLEEQKAEANIHEEGSAEQAAGGQPVSATTDLSDDTVKLWAADALANFASTSSVPCLDAACLTQRQFHAFISPLRIPIILKGLDIGAAPNKWTAEYLMHVSGASDSLVSCHVCREESGAMDFTNKNFSFKIMSLEEMVGRAAKAGRWADAAPLTEGKFPEKYYLRSLGENPRKEPSDIRKAFPQLATDLNFPPFVPSGSEFSTVLRISSEALRLWTHYDVMDNFLIQVTGSKRVLLWAPSDEDNLYVTGSSSPIVHVDQPDLKRFPKFQQAPARSCTLDSGDVLFIPSLWFHNVLSNSFSISVNMFWRHLPQNFYERKDLYGNRDLVAYNVAADLATKISETLAALPDHYLLFYKQRILRQIGSCTSSAESMGP